jgi:hypothetical protein
MKKTLACVVLLSTVLFISEGCKKKSSEITCNLSTAVNQPPVDMQVVYSAAQSGDGVIASLTYETITGTVTVNNPKLPWKDTVSALTTTNVKMTATGTVKNGSLIISYDGDNGSGSKIMGSDYCEQSSD